MPTRVPLPVPRPDFLDALPAEDESAVTRGVRHAPNDAPARAATSPLHGMIEDYARRHGVPLRLAHRIVQQESRYNPALKAKAHFGLMQVSLPTAKSMGYAGDVAGLLDARTNLTYAMPYLANAWIVSGGHEEKARRLYMSGYYPEAKRKGVLKELRKADSPPVSGEIEAADAR
jgi:soluble lytic murein transglycosylase-like protein